MNQQICAICCGTKRLVEIRCPSDCSYLASAREHPPASILRRQQRDVGLVLQYVRDLNERQTELFFLINTFLLTYEPPELQALIDTDIADAAAALASTFETASRGVIYDHRPAGLPADRLATTLKPIIAEASKRAGPLIDREIAIVLRRLEDGARATSGGDASRRAYLDLIGRVLKERTDPPGGNVGNLGDTGTDGPHRPPRLIV